MEDCLEVYKSFVLKEYHELKSNCIDTYVFIETRLVFSKYVPDGFGTDGCVIVSDGIFHIIDYKHDAGVLVSSDHNPQMIVYTLGAIEQFDRLFDVNIIKMTIYQPRLSNVSTFEMSKDDLLKCANEELASKADMAFKGAGSFSCGEWCRFCKARNTCKERANSNLALTAYDFKEPPFLEDDKIVTSPTTRCSCDTPSIIVILFVRCKS